MNLSHLHSPHRLDPRHELVRMSFGAHATLCLLLVVLAAPVASAAGPDTYGPFTLGASSAAVLAATGAAPAALQTRHASPQLLQEMVWRPPYASATLIGGRDSIRDVVLSFLDDRLYQIVVAYDPRGTEGRTSADMVAALTAEYGQPWAATRRAPQLDSIDASVIVARWGTDEAIAALQHSAYGTSYHLVITDVAAARRALQAEAAARRIEAR